MMNATSIPRLTEVYGVVQYRIKQLPPKMAQEASRLWLRIANKRSAYEPHRYHYSIDDANDAVLNLCQAFQAHHLPLDLNVNDHDIVEKAKEMAKKFWWGIQFGRWDLDKQLEKAQSFGMDCQSIFHKQLKKGWFDSISARLQDELFWRRYLRRQVARQLEYVQRHHFNLIHKNKQLYCSDDAVMRRRQQKLRALAVLQAMSVVNEMGQEFALSEIVEKSNANPAIRRAELMVRIAGFETIARDLNHVGEFITLTCPSRFHRAHHWGGENIKYDGSSPNDANDYLNKVWGRIQAALKREKIHIYGFRVVEPHHDGCPHWHGLFFMEKQDRMTFRRIVARYACRENREELHLNYFETKEEAKQYAKSLQAKYTQKKPSLAKLLIGLHVESEFWSQADYKTFHQVSARVDFEKIDFNRGTAAGYIAKYISKNIDGKRNDGTSIGEDFEALNGEDSIETAERVDAWASLYRIRQFQQIGGAPVSVWRELRRENMAVGNVENSEIARAALAADKGDWAKFMMIMGGVHKRNKDRPIRLYREMPEMLAESCERKPLVNRYGEPAAPVIRGVLEVSTGEIRISRIHEWVLKGGDVIAPAWTCVNNSTKLSKQDKNIDLIKENKELNDYKTLSYYLKMVEQDLGLSQKSFLEQEVLQSYIALNIDDTPNFIRKIQLEHNQYVMMRLAEIKHFEETGCLKNGLSLKAMAQKHFNNYQAFEREQKQSDEMFMQHHELEREKMDWVIAVRELDKLLPTIQKQNKEKQRIKDNELSKQLYKTRKQGQYKFVPVKHYENSLDKHLNKLNNLLDDIDNLFTYADDGNYLIE